MGDEKPSEDGVAKNEQLIAPTEPSTSSSNDPRTQNSQTFLEVSRFVNDSNGREEKEEDMCVTSFRQCVNVRGRSQSDFNSLLKECPTSSCRNQISRKCQRRIKDIIGKHELKKEELARRERDLNERIKMLECSMPIVMVWKIWKVTQNVKTDTIHSVVKKLLLETFSKTHECPWLPGQYDDFTVGEIEAWGKGAPCREEETCSFQETSSARERPGEKIEKLTIEAQNAAETLKAQAGAMNDEPSEAGEYKETNHYERSLERSPSLTSIRSVDIDCLRRLRELAEAEIAIKRRILDLERREEIYVKTLKLSNDLWTKIEEEPVIELEKQLEQTNQDYQGLVSQVYELKAELEKVYQDKQELMKANELVKKRMDDDLVKLNLEKQRLSEASKVLSRRLEDDLNKMSQEMQQLSDMNVDLKKERDELQQINHENKRLLKMSDHSLKQLKNDLKQTKYEKEQISEMNVALKKHLKDEIEKVNREKQQHLEMWKLSNKSLERDLEKKIIETQKLSEMNNALQNQLKDDISRINKDKQQLQEKLKKLNQENQQLLEKNQLLKIQFNNAIRKMETSLKKQLKDDMEKLNREKQQILETNEKVKKKLVNELEKLNQDNKYLTEMNEALKKKHEDELNKMNREKQQLSETNDQTKKKCKGDLEKANRDNEKLSEMYEALKKQLDNEVNEKQKVLESYEQIKEKLSKMNKIGKQRFANELNYINLEKQQLLERNEKEKKKLENELEKMNCDFQKVREINEILQKQHVDELNKMNREMKHILEMSERAEKEFKDSLNKANIELKQLRDNLANINIEKRILSEVNERLLQDLRYSESALTKYTNIIQVETMSGNDDIASVEDKAITATVKVKDSNTLANVQIISTNMNDAEDVFPIKHIQNDANNFISKEDIDYLDVAKNKLARIVNLGKDLKMSEALITPNPTYTQVYMITGTSTNDNDSIESMPTQENNETCKDNNTEKSKKNYDCCGHPSTSVEQRKSSESSSSNSFVCGPDVQCWDSDNAGACPPDFNCNNCLEFDEDLQAYVSPKSKKKKDTLKSTSACPEMPKQSKHDSKIPVLDSKLSKPKIEPKKSVRSEEEIQSTDFQNCKKATQSSDKQPDCCYKDNVCSKAQTQPISAKEVKFSPKHQAKIDGVEKIVEERLRKDVCLCRPISRMWGRHGNKIEPCGIIPLSHIPDSESARSISRLCRCLGKSKYKEVCANAWTSTKQRRTTNKHTATFADSTMQTDPELQKNDLYVNCDHCGKSVKLDEIVEIPSDDLESVVCCPCEEKRRKIHKKGGKSKTTKPELSCPETSEAGKKKHLKDHFSQSSCTCIICKCDESDEDASISSSYCMPSVKSQKAMDCASRSMHLKEAECQAAPSKKCVDFVQNTSESIGTDAIKSTREISTSCHEITFREKLLYAAQMGDLCENADVPMSCHDIADDLESRQLSIRAQVLRARELGINFLEDNNPVTSCERDRLDQCCSACIPTSKPDTQSYNENGNVNCNISRIRAPNTQTLDLDKSVMTNTESLEVCSNCHCTNSVSSGDISAPTARGICNCDSDSC